MEWYFSIGVDDLVVPRDQEPSDRLPSPNSWSQWGEFTSENFKSENKCFITQTNSTGEEEPKFSGKSLYEEEVDMDLTSQEAEHSSDSNAYHSFQEGSLQQATSPWESPDYQLNDLAGTYSTDDNFLSSLLEEDPTGMDSLDGSFNLYPKFEHGVLPADDLLTDMIIESDYDPSHLFVMGSSKYLKTHASSPSVDWGHGDVATLHTPRNLRQKDNPPLKALVAKFAPSSELDIVNRHVDDETTLEVSVLHELERAMTQLSEKTRICFRDALYRLAKNSQQQMVIDDQDLTPEEPPPLTDHDETLRLEDTKTMESETNSIDRAVANLMFSKVDSGGIDLLAAVSSKEEAKVITKQCNYSLNQPQQPHWHHHSRSSTGDAEVPIFG